MKIIVCLDINDGMLFNKRRQSRDSAVIKNILDYVRNSTLWIDEYSRELYKDYINCVKVDQDMTKMAKMGDFCFVETSDIKDLDIEELVIYRWDKIYPADKIFDVDYSSMTLVSKLEFSGTSHDKIIREVYR